MYEQIKKIIESSNNIVFYCGEEFDYKNDENSLFKLSDSDILENRKERKRILSKEYLVSNTKEFFEYYNDVIIQNSGAIYCYAGKSYKILSQLEKTGKLSVVITENIVGLHKKSGLSNVIQLYGNIDSNYCVNCNYEYNLIYMQNSQQIIPRCINCGSVVRPGIVLEGEEIDYLRLNLAIDYIKKADVFFVAGANLDEFPLNELVKYYNGNKLIVVTRVLGEPKKHRPNFYINSYVDAFLEKIIDYKETNEDEDEKLYIDTENLFVPEKDDRYNKYMDDPFQKDEDSVDKKVIEFKEIQDKIEETSESFRENQKLSQEGFKELSKLKQELVEKSSELFENGENNSNVSEKNQANILSELQEIQNKVNEKNKELVKLQSTLEEQNKELKGMQLAYNSRKSELQHIEELSEEKRKELDKINKERGKKSLEIQKKNQSLEEISSLFEEKNDQLRRIEEKVTRKLVQLKAVNVALKNEKIKYELLKKSNLRLKNKELELATNIEEYINIPFLRADFNIYDLEATCNFAIKNNCYSVTTTTMYAEDLNKFLGTSNVKRSIVIGYPFGMSSLKIKQKEIEEAIYYNADEIEVVINIGQIKSGKIADIVKDINKLKKYTQNSLFKISTDFSLLTKDEKIKFCQQIVKADVHTIKLGSGLYSSNSLLDDIEILMSNMKQKEKFIEVYGDINSLSFSLKVLEQGVNRIQTPYYKDIIL